MRASDIELQAKNIYQTIQTVIGIDVTKEKPSAPPKAAV